MVILTKIIRNTREMNPSHVSTLFDPAQLCSAVESSYVNNVVMLSLQDSYISKMTYISPIN